MGSLYRSKLISWCKDQEGTEENPMGSNRTIYGELVDRVGLFCGEKNGIAWCGTYCEAGVFDCVFDDTNPDYDDNDRKWDTLFFLYQPSPSSNYACACKWFAKYMRDAGAWHGKDDFEEGDIVFFGDEGDEYHQGIVVGRPDDRCGFYSSEGNHNNRVETVWHDIDENISGFGRPNYDDEPSDVEPEPEPTPEPAPAPVPDPEPTPAPPTKEVYKVTTNGGVLRLRSAPNTDSAYLIGIPNGTEIEVSAIVDGEMINWCEDWAKTCYEGYNGYVSCAWITKV